MSAQDHPVSGEKQNLAVSDCSPEEKLAFFGNVITRSGTLDPECLKKMLPMRYTRCLRKNAPALCQSDAFFAAIKFLINGLLAFDLAFESVIGFKNHIYLLGDDTVRDISARIQHEPPLLAAYDTPAFLDLMGMAGIIYRFNTAKKFGYPARCSNQLRLNGWGRRYAADWHVPSLCKCNPDMDIIAGMIETYRCEYTELAGLCSADRRPLDIERIHQLNLALPFTIVT